MKKSKEVEDVAEAISECLNKLYEGDEPLLFNPFPKIYHSMFDSISIPLIIDGKKIVVEIKAK